MLFRSVTALIFTQGFNGRTTQVLSSKSHVTTGRLKNTRKQSTPRNLSKEPANINTTTAAGGKQQQPTTFLYKTGFP